MTKDDHQIQQLSYVHYAYLLQVYARTSIIDFTVTMRGLEEQLLGRVILTEKQELESERVKLMEEVTANQKKMKELEDNLLYRLTTTKGSLVDDESLIEVWLYTDKLQNKCEKWHNFMEIFSACTFSIKWWHLSAIA